MYSQEDVNALTARINELSTVVKRTALKDAGIVKIDDIDIALAYVTGTSETEIRESISTLADDMPALIRAAVIVEKRTRGVDPSPGGNIRRPPVPFNYEEIGAKQYERIKDKAHGNLQCGSTTQAEMTHVAPARRWR